MKKRPIKKAQNILVFRHGRTVYSIPKKIADKYKAIVGPEFISSDDLFSDINKKYTKPGALLRGLRARENLTQVMLAAKLHVTQSDISQMENGSRVIGRVMAKRIEKIFDVNYRSFLA